MALLAPFTELAIKGAWAFPGEPAQPTHSSLGRNKTPTFAGRSTETPPPALLVSTAVFGPVIPWDLDFTPDGTMLYTERRGWLRSRGTDGTIRRVNAEMGDLFASGETGLMGIVVDPDFASNRRFYTCQGHVGPEVQVIAWTMNAAYTAATRVADPLVGGIPATSGRNGGCRLRFGPEGYLWITTGDAASGSVPQDLTSLGGKVLRVDASTGDGAPTNPFASSPRVYTYGHRNAQGLALRPGTRQMWAVEHGPRWDDEINLLVAGGNYGWDPVPGYNESVSMTDRAKFPDAVEAKWSSGFPTLAVSGGIFLEGKQWGVWEGRLAVATLADSKLRLFEFTKKGDFVSQVIVPELDGTYGRLRTPMMGPDGALYVTTSNPNLVDLILRIAPDDNRRNPPPPQPTPPQPTPPQPTPPQPTPPPAPPPPRGGGGGGGGVLFPPRAPASLAALPGDGVVRLKWSPPESDGGSAIQRYEYRLKDGREEFGEWTPIPDSGPGEVNASRYTVEDLINGTVYVFELRAVNAAGSGRVAEPVEVTMPLDPAYWSNFRAEDLEGAKLTLDAFFSVGSSGDRDLRFGERLRFEEDELDGEGDVTATHSGNYGYRYTSRTTGELSLEFDEGETCRLRLTFSGEGTGSYSYRCGGSSRGQGSFGMSELENRVPEITSLGPFEVEENRTRVVQLEAVDWDGEDEVTGYAIAGGADGGLFAIDERTGELSFREAPDYESPVDMESEEPASEAGDNEYIVVVEVTSGEGERKRSRQQAIRVVVRDVEMEEAVEEEMEETESMFVPVILSSAGRGQSFFTSELTLTNRGEQEAELGYTYTSRDKPEERSGKASDVLPAGRQKIATDALDYLRNLGAPIPETGNQVGTLRVEAPPGSDVQAVVRTTTVVPDGRAGLAYLGVAEEEGFRRTGLPVRAQAEQPGPLQRGLPEHGECG